MPEPTAETLRALGLTRWRLRTSGASAGKSHPTRATLLAEVPAPGPTERLAPAPDLAAIRQAVEVCTACALSESRRRTVFGDGDPAARWMLVGEAPGRDEDIRGEPFVGKAGKLLSAMLAALGLSREAVYLANVVKCRPPDNRDPVQEERASCAPFLEAQLAQVQPELVIALGRVAAETLLGTDLPIGKLRGQVHQMPHRSVPLIVTYHPAYLLRNPIHKARAWQDLLLARRTVLPR